MPLRPYQLDSLKASKERFDAGVKRQLIQLPTGTGKTAVFANLKPHHCFKNRMMVLIHREELAQQAAEKIKLWNPSYSVGIEMADRESSKGDDIVVASVQTLGTSNATRLSKFNAREFDALVPDEAHHAIAPTWKRVFDHFGMLEDSAVKSEGLLLGMTATPNRGDGQGLGQVFDEIVYRMSILDAIRDGWLVDVRGYKIRTTTDISGVSTRAGDFAIGQLEDAVNVDSRNHLIVQNWMVRGQDRQTVAFCVDIAHAKRLAEVFKLYGVAAEAVWGNDPDRREKIKWHKAGGIRVLTNCGVLTEGYDDWRIGCIIMARPTKSQLLFVQMAGRGTRIQDDIHNLNEARANGLTIKKEDCILLDVVDNTGKHSLVTLASLFGLGDKTDLKGKTVTQAKAEIDKAKEKYPNVDLSHIDSIEDIQAEIERVDLFSVKWEPEVLANSQFQWKKLGENDYSLRLPHNGESVRIYQDLLDRWNVAGTVAGSSFAMQGLHSLPEAFTQGDNFIQSHGASLLKLLRREAKWHKNKISIPQRNMIKNLYKYEPHVLAQLDTLSRGEASMLIDKKFSNKAGKAGTNGTSTNTIIQN
jgi:superfamily II DNA or RNA helicase